MSSAPSPTPVYHRKNPYPAVMMRSRSLTAPGSGKDTRHFELSLGASGLRYLPGDSLGVFASNPAALVRELLEHLKLDAAEEVTLPQGGRTSFEKALTHHYVLNRANRKLLHGIFDRLRAGPVKDRLQSLLDADPAVADYLETRDYLDVLADFPGAAFESAEAWIKVLSPIQPRLYSIASSQEAHPDEVHLCVAVVRYETHGRKKTGLASGFLADHVVLEETPIPVFVQESHKFKLPEARERDIIMVGPGTGIAPFRAFLEQRSITGGQGRNWLFFGEQHQSTDFFYREDLELWKSKGVLTRLDLAFSRDQTQKIYVQHRMLEHSAELWRWIEGGAYFYVCGDARRMAKDVHSTLIQIASEQGAMSLEAATHYVDTVLMKEQKRYLRDVY